MIGNKTKTRPSTRIWPYTPEPSPPLEATEIQVTINDGFKMAAETTKARPISVISKRDGVLSPGGRPTLDDVLNNKAPAPYTLAAYTAFLSQQHCLETLEFVTESRKYGDKYYENLAQMCGMPMTTDTDDGFELMQDWIRLMDVYVKPGAPREINLPAEERDDLIDESYDPKPPRPETLEPAVNRMRDLMSDSIFIPFCNSVKAVSHAQTYSALSDFAHDSDRLETTAMTYNDSAAGFHRRQPSSRRKSPPHNTSAFQPSRSPPQHSNRSSALTSALNRNSNARLSTHVSNSSAVSESALTDDSGSGGSPTVGELDSMATPPLTPPTGDLPPTQSSQPAQVIQHHHPLGPAHGPKPSRSESGGWKRMGMKIFGQKKKE